MKTPKSIYRGVSLSFDPFYLNTNTVMWEARIMVKGKRKALGAFRTEWEAAEAYNAEAVKCGRKLNKRRERFENK